MKESLISDMLIVAISISSATISVMFIDESVLKVLIGDKTGGSVRLDAFHRTFCSKYSTGIQLRCCLPLYCLR